MYTVFLFAFPLIVSEKLPFKFVTRVPWIFLKYSSSPSFILTETKNGTDRYIYISNTMQWTGAQAYCRQYHTDLASTRDENEYAIIMGLISGETWFGMSKDPWKWVDHTNFSTLSWISRQPDNYYWNENCGYINMGQVGDAKCSKVFPFFCYSGMSQYIYVSFKVTFLTAFRT